MDVEVGTDADFEAGYAGTGAPAAAMQPTTTETDKKDDKPAEGTEAQATAAADTKTDPAPAPSTTPDPAKEPESEPEWKKAFTELEKRQRNVEGHIGGLTAAQKRLVETMAAAQAAAKVAPDAPTQAQLDKAIKDPEEWKSLEGDFPEWARGTKALIDARLQGVQKVDPAELERKAIAAAVETSLEGIYPGWADELKKDVETKSPEFVSWFNELPEEKRRWFTSDDRREAARFVRLYEQFKNKPAAAPTPPAPPEPPKDTSRKDRFAAAVAPKGTAATPAPGKSEEDELMAGYTGR